MNKWSCTLIITTYNIVIKRKFIPLTQIFIIQKHKKMISDDNLLIHNYHLIITIFSFTLLFGDKLHRASYCHNKLLSPYTPSICPTAQFVTKVTRVWAGSAGFDPLTAVFSASADWTLCQLGYESEVQKRLNRRPYRLLSHLSDVYPVLHCHDFHVSVCHLHQYGGWDV